MKKIPPELVPLIIRGVVLLGAAAGWYFFGKPVDETELQDIVELLVGLAVGKELLPQAGK